MIKHAMFTLRCAMTRICDVIIRVEEKTILIIMLAY